MEKKWRQIVVMKPEQFQLQQPTVESKVCGRKKSVAWDNFRKINTFRAECIHCNQEVTYRSQKSTNTRTMLHHMARCKKLHPEAEVEVVGSKRFRQATLMHKGKKNQNQEAVPSYLQFNEEDCKIGLVRMIIKDEMPFRIVKRKDFENLFSFSSLALKFFKKNSH
ncbi:unnamed protein product [Microthlaspi erraticum]|uniref:BED-type domain-containing protein n=1 Tax=Microthlaspi erraticum TaxID=1685480 RepID=A0A6D2I634_9BRAS|nr:unnamed protein product [Microthlaspi erraticum]